MIFCAVFPPSVFCLFVLVWCCYWCWVSTNTSTSHLQYPTLLDQIRLVFLSRPHFQKNHIYGPQVIHRMPQLQMQNFPSVIQHKAECPPPASAELKARRILHNIGVHAVPVDHHKIPGDQKSQAKPDRAEQSRFQWSPCLSKGPFPVVRPICRIYPNAELEFMPASDAIV